MRRIVCQLVTQMLQYYSFVFPPPVLNLGLFCPLSFCVLLSALFRRTFRLHSIAFISVCLLLAYTPVSPSFVVRAAEQPEVSCLREQHRGAPTPRHDPNGKSIAEAQSYPGVPYPTTSSTYFALTTPFVSAAVNNSTLEENIVYY